LQNACVLPRFLLLPLATFFLPLSASAQVRAEIPFELREGLICLNVNVASAPKPLRFVLDSGAGLSALNWDAARKLKLRLGAPAWVVGVEGGADARWVHGFAARVGHVPLISDLLVFDLRQINPNSPGGIDGLLGQDFFRGRIVQIDFRKKRIRLLERADHASSAVLPIKFQNGAMCVPVSVGGSAPRWTRLDTGCNDDLHWVGVRPSRSRRPGPLVGFSRGPLAYVDTVVDLAEYRISGVQAGLHAREFFPGEAGLLGTGILSNFTVTVDDPGGRVLLKKN
jgi:Aspartyl protease